MANDDALKELTDEELEAELERRQDESTAEYHAELAARQPKPVAVPDWDSVIAVYEAYIADIAAGKPVSEIDVFQKTIAAIYEWKVLTWINLMRDRPKD